MRACKQRFLHDMSGEVRGYQLDACSGPDGCPNRAVAWGDVYNRVEKALIGRQLKEFLKERVSGPLKAHHKFRVSISDCPNACSRPQVADLGLIGACRPGVSGEACSRCGACEEVCREKAILFERDAPVVDYGRCLSCGQCLAACPTGTLKEDSQGYRVLVGGKLGRHPRLGVELPGIHGLDDALERVESCLDYYQENCHKGERFGAVLGRTGLGPLILGIRRQVTSPQTP